MFLHAHYQPDHSKSDGYGPEAPGNADGLSRLPVREDQSCTSDDAMVFNIAQLDALPVCSSELMAATHTDRYSY